MNKRQARIAALSTSLSCLQGYLDAGHLYDKYESEEDAEKESKEIEGIISHLHDQYRYIAAREREATQAKR